MVKKKADNYLESFNAACEANSYKIIRFLLDNKKIINLESGLFIACKTGNRTLMKFLKKRGAKNLNNCLYQACIDNDKHYVKFIIDLGAKDFVGAIKYAKSDDVKKLLN
jgi:ankyrin repeat protein